MYQLYWHPNASSLAPMAVLEELGVEFDLHQVNYDGGETRTPEYQSLQPLGLIPALKFEDGSSMFESAAIVLFLCDRHRQPELAPSLEDPERPRYIQWLFFMADTIYPSYNRYYRSERYTADPEGVPGVKEQARLERTQAVASHRGLPSEKWALAPRRSILCLRYLLADVDDLARVAPQPSRKLSCNSATGARCRCERRLSTCNPTA